MYNLIKRCNSGWKMTPFDAKLVSNKSCFYHDIFFATRTRVPWKNEKSVILSVLSVLICRSMLPFLATGDAITCWLAQCALTRLCQQQCLQAASSVGSSWSWDGSVYSFCCNFPCNCFVSVQTGLKRENKTSNEIKCEPAQSAAVKLFRNESHATAKASLLAH